MINEMHESFLSYKEVHDIGDSLMKLPREYLLKQEDCNREDFIYQDEDVIQLRPSTVPVFLLKQRNIVIKIMIDKVKAENEYNARVLLKDKLNIIPLAIISLQESNSSINAVCAKCHFAKKVASKRFNGVL